MDLWYKQGVLKRHVCIGFYPLDRQFLSAGETHFLPWSSATPPPATPALEPQVAPIDQNHVELHVGGHRAGGRSLFARNVRRLLLTSAVLNTPVDHSCST
jgi:hypothetical protein